MVHQLDTKKLNLFVEKKGENTYFTANLHFKPSNDE